MIARNIRAMRNTAGLSQSEAAQRAGVSASYLCQCESGKKIPSLAVIAKLAKAFCCRLSDLVDDDETERRAG